MNILAVDTSSTFCVVALRVGGVLYRHEEESGWRHLQELMPAIEGVLETSATELADIELLVCSDGPGSFTGLRIGCATAKGLVAATGLPYVCVPMGEVYRAMYRAHRGDYGVAIPITKLRCALWWRGAQGGEPRVRDTAYHEVPAVVRELSGADARGVTLCVRESAVYDTVKALFEQRGGTDSHQNQEQDADARHEQEQDTDAHQNQKQDQNTDAHQIGTQPLPSNRAPRIVRVGSIAEYLVALGEKRYATFGGAPPTFQPTYFRRIEAELASERSAEVASERSSGDIAGRVGSG